jgi:hypothetical protein
VEGKSPGHGWWSRGSGGGRGDAWSGGGAHFRAWLGARGRAHRGQRTRGPLGWAWLAGRCTALVALVLFAVPLVWSRTNDICAAFEVAAAQLPAGRAIRGLPAAATGSLPRNVREISVSRGLAGERAAAAAHPRLPAIVACTLLFWQARANALAPGG